MALISVTGVMDFSAFVGMYDLQVWSTLRHLPCHQTQHEFNSPTMPERDWPAVAQVLEQLEGKFICIGTAM